MCEFEVHLSNEVTEPTWEKSWDGSYYLLVPPECKVITPGEHEIKEQNGALVLLSKVLTAPEQVVKWAMPLARECRHILSEGKVEINGLLAA